MGLQATKKREDVWKVHLKNRKSFCHQSHRKRFSHQVWVIGTWKMEDDEALEVFCCSDLLSVWTLCLPIRSHHFQKCGSIFQNLSSWKDVIQKNFQNGWDAFGDFTALAACFLFFSPSLWARFVASFGLVWALGFRLISSWILRLVNPRLFTGVPF